MIMLSPQKSPMPCPHASVASSSTRKVTSPPPVTVLNPWTQLDFGELKPFERVQDQYQSLGIRFEGAIALLPSNPAFSAHTETPVLMPAASRASLTAHFLTPVQQVHLQVVGVRQVSLTVFDSQHRLTLQKIVNNYRMLNSLTDLEDPLKHHSFEISVSAIARIVVESDDPFIINHLKFQ